jgi:hypothetical protein
MERHLGPERDVRRRRPQLRLRGGVLFGDLELRLQLLARRVL